MTHPWPWPRTTRQEHDHCFAAHIWHLACALSARCTNHIARTTATTPHATPTRKHVNTWPRRQIHMHVAHRNTGPQRLTRASTDPSHHCRLLRGHLDPVRPHSGGGCFLQSYDGWLLVAPDHHFCGPYTEDLSNEPPDGALVGTYPWEPWHR